MIRAVIVDDERDSRFLLRNLIEKKFSDKVQIVAEADDVEPGIEAIKKNSPDLLFLDINMPQGTGFDLLSNLDSESFEVIFVTAYDKYAIKAFQLSAFGYLMKPLKETQLAELLKKLEEKQALERNHANLEKRVKVLIENYGDHKKVRKLVLSNMEGFKVVEIENIIRLEGDGNYTNFIIDNNRSLTSSKNLGEYEDLLIELGFFRIHQSTIVNLRHVVGFQKSEGGQVEMSDGVLGKLSRHRKTMFMERFFDK